MTTSDAVDMVRAQRIEGSDFWRSGNQGQRRGGGWGLDAFEGVKLIKLERVTEKVVACHMTCGATGAKNSGTRPPETASNVPKTRVEL
jgi:hypothetical protein